MVHQSHVLKQFLAGTYYNQILHLNSFSESEKTVDLKNLSFPKNRPIVLPEIACTLKSLKINLWFTIFFLLAMRGYHYCSLSCAK